MERPGAIYVPALYVGNEAVISWDPVPSATRYVLERSTGGSYETLYSGPNTSYQDTVPDVSSLEYRVRAVQEIPESVGRPWAEIEAPTWNQWDAVGGWWVDQLSEWTESGPVDVYEIGPPVISDSDRNLGAYYQGFSVPFAVTSNNPNAQISAEIFLDGSPIQTITPVVLGQTYQVTITDQQVAGMAIGSTHTIEIVAADSIGTSAARRFTFSVVEDFVSDAVFYVLRDGVPVARLTRERDWTDYLASGTHSYRIRGVDRNDNHVDSNELTLTLILEHPTVAPADSPEEMLDMVVRRGAPSSIVDTVSAPNTTEMYFEGRELPVVVAGEGKSKGISLEFTNLTLAECKQLEGLVRRTVIYRDQYENRVFGVVTTIEQSAVHRRVTCRGDAVVDYVATLQETEFSEAISYV